MRISEATAHVQEALAPRVESGHLPGYVGGLSVAGEACVCAAGTLALGSEDEVDARTIFRIASLTKPIAGALALTLVQDGTLALNDEVGRWLPELAEPRVLRTADGPLDDTVPAKRPIMVRDLLTMTAGFGLLLGRSPLRTAMLDSDLTPGPLPPPVSYDEFMGRLAALPLAVQPGEGWIYHTCADVLAVLLAGRPTAPAESCCASASSSPWG